MIKEIVPTVRSQAVEEQRERKARLNMINEAAQNAQSPSGFPIIETIIAGAAIAALVIVIV